MKRSTTLMLCCALSFACMRQEDELATAHDAIGDDPLLESAWFHATTGQPITAEEQDAITSFYDTYQTSAEISAETRALIADAAAQIENLGIQPETFEQRAGELSVEFDDAFEEIGAEVVEPASNEEGMFATSSLGLKAAPKPGWGYWVGQGVGFVLWLPAVIACADRYHEVSDTERDVCLFLNLYWDAGCAEGWNAINMTACSTSFGITYVAEDVDYAKCCTGSPPAPPTSGGNCNPGCNPGFVCSPANVCIQGAQLNQGCHQDWYCLQGVCEIPPGLCRPAQQPNVAGD
jgi:hypothetical protein